MRPEQKSKTVLSITRSKAKMYEYNIPEKYHISISQDPGRLFTLSIGILGDLSAGTNRGDLQPENYDVLRQDLNFSAQFFDAYLQSKLNTGIDFYLILLGSASYYLCDLPGSSMVLAKQIQSECPDVEGKGLENLLLWMLKGDISNQLKGRKGPYGNFIDSISYWLLSYLKNGTGIEELFKLSDLMRNAVYESGTPRELLLGDVIASVVRKKCENSSWHTLPLYSGLSSQQWQKAIKKKRFIKELWPAQHLIGRKGVLKGKSAVIQIAGCKFSSAKIER